MQRKWYHYLFGFLAGVILVNFIPHFISGLIGNRFPTPFATPPGRGLSSPVVNISWAMINLFLGSLFFFLSKATQEKQSKVLWGLMVLGAVAMSFFIASHFGRVLHH